METTSLTSSQANQSTINETERIMAASMQWASYAEEMQKGNLSAFTELYNDSFNYAFHISKSYIPNEQDAMDIVQDGYEQVFRKINTLKDPKKFMGWMKRIFTNTALNYLQKKRPDLILDSEDYHYVEKNETEDKDPEFKYLDKETRSILQDLLSELPEKQQLVIQLVYIEEMSISDTALLLGVSEGTVKSRLFNGRRSLEDLIFKYEEKNDVKLHSIGAIPVLLHCLGLFRVVEPVSTGIKSNMWNNLVHSLKSMHLTAVETITEDISSAVAGSPIPQEVASTLATTATTAGTAASTAVASTVATTTTAVAGKAITATIGSSVMKIVTGALIVSATVGGVVATNHIINKDNPTPPDNPVQIEQVLTDESSEDQLLTEGESESEVAFVLPVLEEQDMYTNPYLAQRMGTNPAYYIKHPTLPIALDFRDNEELARTLFVEPTEKGFRFRERYYINANQSLSVFNQIVIEEDDDYSTAIEIIETKEELSSLQSSDTRMMGPAAPVVFQVGEQHYAFKNKITDGKDLLSIIQIQQLEVPFITYDKVTNQRTMDVMNYVVEAEDGIPNEGKNTLSAEDEFEEIKRMLEEDAVSFELQYGMPLLNTVSGYTLLSKEKAEIFSEPRDGEDFFDTSLLPVTGDEMDPNILFTNPDYSYGTFDIDGDGNKEYLVKGKAEIISYDATEITPPAMGGYTAIFKESEQGLRLINAFIDEQVLTRYLLYSEGYLYTMQIIPELGEYCIILNVYPYYSDLALEDQVNLIEQPETIREAHSFETLKEFFESKSLFVIDTNLDHLQTNNDIDTMKEASLEDILDLENNLDQFSMSGDNLDGDDEQEEPMIKIEATGEPKNPLEGIIEKKDLAPDMYVEYAEFDLLGDGNQVVVVHTQEIAASEGAPMTRTWEIFLSTEQGPECFYIDYFGKYPLIFNGDQVITLSWSGIQGEPVLVRKQPLRQETNWIGAYATDYDDYENRLGQAEPWVVNDLFNLTDEEKEDFAERFLTEGKVTVIPAQENRQRHLDTGEQTFWATPRIYRSATDYIEDPEFLLH